jgi:hypothetical protein
MKEEDKAKKAAYQKKWYEANKARHIANVSARKAIVMEEVKDYVRTLKESTPCADCKNLFPFFVMDFDHLKDKLKDISELVGGGYGLEKIKAEIAKCEIVCANCHRIRTFTRNGMHVV